MKAQEIALKTNLVYDALLTVNLGAEAKLPPDGRSTFRVISTHGLSIMARSGSTGWCSPRLATGSVTLWQDTL